MAATLSWDDIGDIADALFAAYPDLEPLTVSFPRLLQMILGLAEFSGEPDAANERRLEAIQMAWYDLAEG
ncbi:MAG TPA: Fe-S cluster assembly protein IscX [Armatimonadota bacterium]